MKKKRFLILKVREDKKHNFLIKTLTPLEDGFLKKFIKKEVYAYA
ncbi:MAG: hypothetical protein QMD25_01655 [Caldisericia bacterium]|nr:hypothetical protein [Caldisericia bacterium]